MQSLNAVPQVSSLAIWESQLGEDAVLECSTSSFLSSQLVAPVDPANVPGLSVSNAVYVVPFSESSLPVLVLRPADIVGVSWAKH